MQTRELSEHGMHILALDGEIDLACSPELRDVLQVQAKARRPVLVLDFAGVSYVDSSGLATLIEYVRKAQAFGGSFALVNVSAGRRALACTCSTSRNSGEHARSISPSRARMCSPFSEISRVCIRRGGLAARVRGRKGKVRGLE